MVSTGTLMARLGGMAATILVRSSGGNPATIGASDTATSFSFGGVDVTAGSDDLAVTTGVLDVLGAAVSPFTDTYRRALRTSPVNLDLTR